MTITRRSAVTLLALIVALWPAPGAAQASTVVSTIYEAVHNGTRHKAAPECLPPPTYVDPRVPWAQRRLAPERAWDLTRGANVIVAVVDTGVDGATPQLAGRVLRGSDLITSGGRGDTDCFGHGTFVAGIIAASPAAGAGFVGIAPEARILPVRVTNEDEGLPDVFAAGIRTAVDAGAKVINVSASTTAHDARLVEAVEYAESRDVVVVAAAANVSGSANSGEFQPAYPAALPSVLAVAAVDATGQRASFSQPGPYIGLAAPGADVTSVGPGGPGHWQGSGTSYAAPFVAGVAALVRAYRPGLTAAQVRHRLKVTADRPTTVPDPSLGWGIVNPHAALATVLPEEGSAGGSVHAQPSARRPLLPSDDRAGPLLVLLGAGAMLIIVGLAGLLAVLGPSGQRRRWRPARVQRVTVDHPQRR
jgi:type VII secretion-associated serine protease mycosin